eukprot:1138057-Pelagomonas_calceolata.AAC.1
MPDTLRTPHLQLQAACLHCAGPWRRGMRPRYCAHAAPAGHGVAQVSGVAGDGRKVCRTFKAYRTQPQYCAPAAPAGHGVAQ